MASRRRRRSRALREAQLAQHGLYRTRTGKVLTEDDIEVMAAAGDAGYLNPMWSLVRELDLSLRVLRDRNATVVSVQAPWGQEASGSAKREPGDPDNPEIAFFLAAGRALAELGKDMQERGSALVLAAEVERRAQISENIKRAERRILQRNSPVGHFMGTQRIHEEYGYEAALKHEARRNARIKGTEWLEELNSLVKARQERERAGVLAENERLAREKAAREQPLTLQAGERVQLIAPDPVPGSASVKKPPFVIPDAAPGGMGGPAVHAASSRHTDDPAENAAAVKAVRGRALRDPNGRFTRQERLEGDQPPGTRTIAKETLLGRKQGTRD